MKLEEHLRELELQPQAILHNLSIARLYEIAVCSDGARLSNAGAIVTSSGLRTGRCPSDRRIVENPESQHDIWWGEVNMPLRPMSYRINRRRAIDFLNTRPHLFVIDGFAGWDKAYRIKVRVICARPYHALFARNMLIGPTKDEADAFGKPDLTIFNAGAFPADPLTPDVTSDASVDINLEAGEMVILGTEYAGELKKGIFSVLQYLLPPRNVLTLHAAANEGTTGDVSVFLGLSGTGKTTLSADPTRKLIGDDELGWSPHGVFNLEGGCYAKCHSLSASRHPVIHRAIQFGCVLENVTLNEKTGEIDFESTSLTENTRASYPLSSVPQTKRIATASHPTNVIMLACDAFGVLPPVSRLTHEQTRFHFLNGYTAKTAGTEQGVREPIATFSPCYGGAFLTRRPACYVNLFMDRIDEHQPQVWMLNTGWIGGDFRTGRRIDLDVTRKIVDAIHDGSLIESEMLVEPTLNLQVPQRCGDLPTSLLNPRMSWSEPTEYDATASRLRARFLSNFKRLDHQVLQLTSNTSEYHRATF